MDIYINDWEFKKTIENINNKTIDELNKDLEKFKKDYPEKYNQIIQEGGD